MEGNWPAYLASAGVGAVASSIVNVIAQALERHSRRSEMIWAKALEVAHQRTETAIRIADASGRKANLYDPVITAETYHRWLTSLLRSGRLPDEPRVRQGRPPEPPEA